MIVSLELCTHWVMVCFVANHYTAKAFYVLGISIWGFGLYGYQSIEKRVFIRDYGNMLDRY